MGAYLQACVIIWDFEKQTILSQHEHHKVRVEAVVFSKDERYLISLGNFTINLHYLIEVIIHPDFDGTVPILGGLSSVMPIFKNAAF